MTNGDNEIIIANRNGRAIRFHESAVRVMGRTATGVRGMTLDEDGQDEVVGMICIKDPEAETIMVVSEQYIMAVDKFLVVQVLHAQIGVYSIVRVDIQQILDGTTFRILSTFGDFVYLQPVTLTFLCKEHHGIMHGCRINMLSLSVKTTV